MKSLPFLLLVLISLLVGGCHYHSCLDETAVSHKVLSIPYAKGDNDGSFTAILYAKMAKKGLFRLARSGGDLQLIVVLQPPTTETVGFRYETNPDGVLGQRLVSSEEELRIEATMELVDLRTCMRIVGPLCVKEELRFDFAPDTSPQNDTTFSVGQLDFEPAAKDAAMEPLYNKLAQQIAELIWVYGLDHAL